MKTHRSGDGIELLIELELQIDDAVLTEVRNWNARPRVESNQSITRRHVENPFLTTVGPIREAPAGQLPGRSGATRTFVLAVHPEHFSRGRVQRDDRAPGAGRRKQAPVDHERCRFEIEFRSRTEMVGLETPGNLQLAEVLGRDLSQ